MPAGEDNGHGATQGRRGLVAAKIDLDEAVFVLAVPSPVGIECGDRQAVRGAELNPRLRAVFIMPEQLLNLRRRAALPVLGLLHPFSKPDPSLTGNQGVTHTLTFEWGLRPQTPGIYRLRPGSRTADGAGIPLHSSPALSRRSGSIPRVPYPPLSRLSSYTRLRFRFSQNP